MRERNVGCCGWRDKGRACVLESERNEDGERERDERAVASYELPH